MGKTIKLTLLISFFAPACICSANQEPVGRRGCDHYVGQWEEIKNLKLDEEIQVQKNKRSHWFNNAAGCLFCPG